MDECKNAIELFLMANLCVKETVGLTNRTLHLMAKPGARIALNLTNRLTAKLWLIISPGLANRLIYVNG